MRNQIVERLIKNKDMFISGNEIATGFELSEMLHKALSESKIKVTFHFEEETGKLAFDKVLGRDKNDDFYNEKNGNLDARKEEAKNIIVSVLVKKYNSLAQH